VRGILDPLVFLKMDRGGAALRLSLILGSPSMVARVRYAPQLNGNSDFAQTYAEVERKSE
jgi:hypothetical protein